MTVKFCLKCHREAYRIKESEDKIEVIQGGKTILNLNRKSSVTMSISCSKGHPVKLEIKPVKVESRDESNKD